MQNLFRNMVLLVSVLTVGASAAQAREVFCHSDVTDEWVRILMDEGFPSVLKFGQSDSEKLDLTIPKGVVQQIRDDRLRFFYEPISDIRFEVYGSVTGSKGVFDIFRDDGIKRLVNNASVFKCRELK